jgi:hypothetical protein
MKQYSTKEFVFTVGPSGSGKSSSFPNGFEADKYPHLYHTNGSINKKLLKLAHHKCLQDCIGKMILQDDMVIQTNTNLNPKLLNEYFKACLKYKYNVRCILPANDLLCYDGEDVDTRSKQVERILSVRSSGIRIIPEDVLYQMINTFDSVKNFYKKMIKETDPQLWLDAIDNPFYDIKTYSVSISDVSNDNIVEKINQNDDVTFYTQLNDKLSIYPQTEDKYQGTYLIQTANRNFSVLFLESELNKGYIILWNDGISQQHIDSFISKMTRLLSTC